MSANRAIEPLSVVIPAHNEQAVIARCLSSLQAGAADGELDIVVVCNGCDDDTAQVARRAAPGANVLELPVASKVAALNAGDQEARYFPRFYLDADIELPIEAVRRVAQELADGALCAAPRPSFVLRDRPWGVRAFYRVWQDVPYHSDGMVGSGVYALSKEGRARFGAFPELTADDQFVHQLFERSERKSVGEAEFLVHTPRTINGLLAMRARAYRGNRELASSGLAQVAPPASGVRAALRKAWDPAQVPAVAVYAAVNIVAKGLARRSHRPAWERDESARSGVTTDAVTARAAQAGQAGGPRVCYVTSHYPALSHTFVMREISGVRAAGIEVETVSVHQANPEHLLAEVDKQEAERTWNIFPLGTAAFLRAHLKAATRSPGAYARTLGRAISSSPPGARSRLWQLFYFAEAIALWDHAERRGARHLHAHLANVAADISWWASAFGKEVEPSAGWAWSFTMHGPTEFFSTEKFNLARKVENADQVICISEFTKSQLMYLTSPQHWEKLRVVHCGVDLARYPYSRPEPHAGFSVLCVARLVPQKGLDVLVGATAVLAAGGLDIQVVLVGSGPEYEPLRRKVNQLGLDERVRFEGAVGQDDMARYFAAADVFCLPSFAEGVPVVLMEAMATGRPVVATRVAGVPELVQDGVSGLLVPPGSEQELALALELLAASAERRVELGEAGRRLVEQDFDAEICAAKLADVFRQIRPGR